MPQMKIGTYKIPVFRPWCDARKLKGFYKAYVSGWWGLGPKTEEFENKFASYLDSNNTLTAVGVNSCTAALHLAMRMAGIQKGDEVITTPLTFASTVEAIIYNEATPIFADVNYDTLNIDPIDIEKKITPKTKAIVPVHYGGNPCDMDAIMAIAQKYNLIVIEDCAHAMGGEYAGSYAGKKIGSLGNLSCFSFHAVKNLPTGDGGMIVFPKNKDIEDRLKRMRWMGITKDTFKRDPTAAAYSWDYDIIEQGWKYHMNDLIATIGIGQLEELDRLNDSRRTLAAKYDKQLSKIRQIAIPIITSNKPARHNYVIKLHGIPREEMMNYLSARNISTGVHYKPLYLHPRYAEYNKHDTPIAETVWKTILTLPLYPSMRPGEIPYILKHIKGYINDLLVRLMIKKKKYNVRPIQNENNPNRI